MELLVSFTLFCLASAMFVSVLLEALDVSEADMHRFVCENLSCFLSKSDTGQDSQVPY